MLAASRFLDPISEMMLLSSTGNTKNIIITGTEVSGVMDESAIRLAIRNAFSKFPHFASIMREVWHKGFRFQYSERIEDPPMTFLNVLQGNRFKTGLDGFLGHITADLDKEWNFAAQAPAHVYVVRFSHNHFMIAPVIHHVAADGGTASEFGREILAQYHTILTGSRPEWAKQTDAMSSSKKRVVSIKQASFSHILKDVRDSLTDMSEKSVIPVGSGTGDSLLQHQIKRILSERDTQILTKLSLQKGVSLIDLLVSTTNRVIDEWNAALNVEPGMLTTSVSVNMKGRFRGFERSNNSALIYFRSTAEERRNPETYARSIALQRIKHFRNQNDFKFFQNVSRMCNSVRLLPLHLRKRAVNYLVNRHEFSIAVTLLGVIWPDMVNGKYTIGTNLERTGNLDVTEVHGLGYKLLSSTRNLLIVYYYRNKLNLVLASSASLFTREEAENFMDQILLQFQDHLAETVEQRKVAN